MFKLNSIREKIAAKKPVVGTAVTLTDTSVADQLATVGFDFLWIDSEHSALDRKEVQSHIMAANGAGAAAFVRVPWNDPVLVKPILDMGPDGIIFPMINTAEEADLAVKSCLYPPKGIRGFAPVRAVQYGMMDMQEYFERAEKDIWKIVQIEHVQAVENIDSIVRVEGLDAFVVGPCDLSGSIGLLSQINHDDVKRLMDRVAEVAVKAKMPFGVATGFNPAVIEEWMNRGVSFVSIGVDFGYITSGAARVLKGVKEVFSA